MPARRQRPRPVLGAVAAARARASPSHTPWRAARYCVIDLELSGLDPRTDEIVSFGAVPIDDGRVSIGSAVYGLVRPTRPLPERSVLVHGLRDDDLSDAPPIDEALEPLIAVMADRVLVAHTAGVERAFLAQALRRRRLRLRSPILDTEVLGRLWLARRGQSSAGWLPLGEIASALGIPVHRPHHAFGDALTTAQVFLALATHLDSEQRETVRTLATARDRLSWHPFGTFGPA